MALITSYLLTTKNAEPFFNSIVSAKAPDVFTQKFLESLEFKSTNDRLYIGLLKGLGFLDETGTPTSRYFDYLDQTQSKYILADAIKEAYEDLFNVNTQAQKMTEDEVKNKLKTLTQGKHSDRVLGLMAKTFKALTSYATWSDKREDVVSKTEDEAYAEDEHQKIPQQRRIELPLHYNIQLILPDSRDPAVYDAIFKTLKNHLY